MSYTIKSKLIVLALSITSSFCFGQQNRSAICRLGELTNDSLLPYIQSLELDCDKDIKSFVNKSEQLTSLKQLQLNGDANPSEWEVLFEKIKVQTKIKTVAFNENTFTSLPYKYEGLFNIENLSFTNVEELDYTAVIEQLLTLPNIRELNLEVVTIFELPSQIDQLKNLTVLRITNTDEFISDNDTTLFSLGKEPITYDYSIKKENGNTVAIKYTAIAGEIDSDEYKELSKRFTTTNNFVSASTFVPQYANICPPIKGIDIERTNYTINPQIENIVTYPSGTKILIPANTFTDKNGNPVTSSVTLSYREFRDPVDFLVSGIPMKYDTAGEVTNFESAGMFELLASSNSEPLSVAKDKSIDMNFVTTSVDSTYNFYAFDDNKGNWEYLNKPKTVTKKTAIQLKSPTPAYNVYQNYARNYKRIYDPTPFDERFANDKYVYTNRKDNISTNKFWYRSQRKNRSKSMYSLIKIHNVKKTKEGTVLFKVSYLDQSHPEMRQFSNVYFASNENITANDFKKAYVRKKFYNDIRINTIGDDVELLLKDKQSVKNISATVVSLDYKGEPQPMRNFSNRMRRYEKRLKTRERRFNKDLAKGRNYLNEIRITDTKQLKIFAYNEAKKQMNADENKMSFKEWEDYCKQTEKNIIEWNKQATEVKLAQLNKSEGTAANLVQSLSLSGTGVYNCDQIQRMKQPVEIFAKYQTTDNTKLTPYSAYILDKKSNSIFAYNGAYGYDVGRIAFSKSKKAENTLLTVDVDGSVSIYRTAEFRKNDFINKSSFDFVVTKIDSKYTSVKELKALIGY